MTKLYNIVTGSNESIKIPRNTYVSWLMPSIPLAPEDLAYCAQGTGTQELLHEAFVFSKLFDMIPGLPKTGDTNIKFLNTDQMLQTINMNNQDTISSVWQDILRFSEVVDIERSDDVKAKLQHYRDLLTVTTEETNIVTGEKMTKIKDGPLTIEYTKKMHEYTAAADAYMNLLIDAQCATGDDPESKRRIAEWKYKSKFLRNNMDAAYMAWVADGYKNEFEEINAYIDMVTRNSMVLYKEDLVKKMDAAKCSSVLEGPAGDFYYTTLIPGDFTENDNWPEFSFTDIDFNSNYNYCCTHWSGSGVLGLFGIFGLFLGGEGGANSTHIEQSSNTKASNFKASFKVTQIPISRPWMDPGFLESQSWRMSRNYSGIGVSNGSLDAPGRMVAYPTSAIFVKDVKLWCNEWESISKYTYDKLEAGGALAIAWGPFLLAGVGSYSKINLSRSYESSFHDGIIELPGIHLIGFINSIVPKCPNTNPDYPPDVFV